MVCICRLMINILVQFVVISWFTWQGDTAQRCWLTDWSPEDWIHHVNERALLSFACLLPHFLAKSCHFPASIKYPQSIHCLLNRPSCSLHKEKNVVDVMDARLNTQQDPSGDISFLTCLPSVVSPSTFVSLQFLHRFRQYTHTRFVWFYVDVLLSQKTWTDLVLLSKLTGALGMRWTHCHQKHTQAQKCAHKKKSVESVVAWCEQRAGPSVFLGALQQGKRPQLCCLEWDRCGGGHKCVFYFIFLTVCVCVTVCVFCSWERLCCQKSSQNRSWQPLSQTQRWEQCVCGCAGGACLHLSVGCMSHRRYSLAYNHTIMYMRPTPNTCYMYILTHLHRLY